MLRRACLLALFALYSLTSLAVAGDTIAGILQRGPVLNPNFSTFSDSSLIDESSRLEAPAGKHGFVTVKNGHFAYTDGTRARFYGVNLAKDTVFINKAQVDRLVNLFARAGINLVRIHHIDDAQGILSQEPGHYFRTERLDIVDYWVAKLKERGIYLCLDLNDYRTFRSADGVVLGEQLGRGAKPYAVFDPKLIELQQEYARRLLIEHVNPYTNLAYANDPAVAFLEIYDENGLFIRRADWQNLRQPYFSAFVQQWNAWLRMKYGSTTALRAAWTDRSGACALMTEETLEAGTVLLPRMDVSHDLEMPWKNPLTAPVRQSEGAQFAYDMQQSYLRVMMTGLREMGVKVPVTAVGAQDILPDLMATASTTDYIGINFYWDHPQWDPGKSWTMPSYFSLKSPIRDNQSYAFPVVTSMAHMYGKPLVVREMGYCFPNPARGVGMIESATYGALLDIDAIILFTFDAYATARTIGYFDIHLDPLRWGLVSQAARIFLSGEVQSSRSLVGIGYSDVDAFTWYDYGSPLYALAYATRVLNYTDIATPNPFSLLVSSGRSSGPQWQGDQLLVYANKRHTDLRFQNMADGVESRYGYNIITGRAGFFDFTFRDLGFDAGETKNLQASPVFSTDDLKAKGLLPVATADTAALGFIDPARRLIGFHNLRPDLVIRVALDALRSWYGAPVSHADIDRGLWRSDTEQIERDTANGLLRIDTPALQAIAGQFDASALLQTSALKLTTTTPVGTITAQTLDGKPLTESTNLWVEMTSKARNDQMKMTPVSGGTKNHRVDSLGLPPIRTDGRPATTPTRVEIGGKFLIELYLQNGSWEYVVEPDRSLLYLDTGDITIHLPVRPKMVRWYTAGDTMEIVPDDVIFTVPTGVRYTEIIW